MESSSASLNGSQPLSLGEEARLDDPEFYAGTPHKTFARLRQEAPVFWNEGTGFWAITGYKQILFVMRHPETFSSEGDQQVDAWVSEREHKFQYSNNDVLPPPGTPNLITCDAPLHTRFKRVLLSSGLFASRVSSDLETAMRQSVTDILDELTPGAVGEVDDLLSARLSTAMIAEFLGMPQTDWQRMQAWSEAIEPPKGLASETAAAAAVRDMWTALEAALENADPDSGLGRLVAAQASSASVSRSALLSFICDAIVAGIESMRATLTGGIVALAEFPAQWERLRRSKIDIAGAVEEIIRWVTPAPSMGRVCTADVELGGAQLRSGDRVLLMFSAANRDESVWDDADQFDVGRATKPAHLGFGHGPHLCVGAPIVRRLLRIALEEMAGRGFTFQLAAPPRREPGFNAHAKYTSALVTFDRVR